MGWRVWMCGAVALFVAAATVQSSAGAVPLSSAQPILDELGKKLEDPSRSEQERLEIILSLEEWGGKQVRPSLLAVLKDPSPALRAVAARALGWPGNREAIPALRERVEAPGEAAAVKAAAVRSLGHIGDRSVRALMIAVTQEPDASIREAALWSLALGPLVDPADRTAFLIRLAEDRGIEAQLRADAIRALATVKEEGVAASLARILEGEPRRTIVLPSGQPTDQQVMALRYAQARDVAAWAAAALGQLEARAALPLLLKSADDPDDFFLRLMSLQSLVAWNAPEAVPVLVSRLEDPLSDIRVLALTGLARLRDRQAVDAALARLADPSPAVRVRAVAVLAGLGGSRVRPQLKALEETESDPDVRGALESALSQLPR